MNTIQSFLSDSVVQALGWTLIHSLWQGALAAIILATLLILMRRYSSTTRYIVSFLVLLLLFCSTVLSFVLNQSPQATTLATEQTFTLPKGSTKALEGTAKEKNTTDHPVVLLENETTATGHEVGFLDNLQNYFAQHIPLLVTLWLFGVLILLLRFLGGLGYVQRLKHYKTTPLPASWQEKAQIFEEKLGIRQSIRYLYSPIAPTPMAIGFIKPVVLLPAKILSGLSTQQIEAILIHELAHIKRHDYSVNLIQSLMEILFFFHPGVWWISSAIRNERENCCDDLAISLTGETTEYAKTLILLQEQQLQAGIPAVAFTGVRHSFSNRVKRLFNQPTRFADFKEGFVTALILIAGILALSFSSAKVFGNDIEPLSTIEIEKTLAPPLSLENTKDTDPNTLAASEGSEDSNTTQPPTPSDESTPSEEMQEDKEDVVIRDNTQMVAGGTVAKPSNTELSKATDDLTVLLRAIDDGDIDIVRFVLEKGVNVNGQTKRGWTPLLEAVDEGDANIVQLLLEKGAKPNLGTKAKWTPLHEAADEGSADITRLLIKAGADIQLKDKHGRTAFMVAVSEDHLAVMEVLLDNGAEINQTYHKNQISPLIEAAEEGHLRIAKILLKRGADVNAATAGGWTALMEAADEGHPEMVQLLLDNGADTQAKDQHGWNALFHATDEGNIQVVEKLLDNGMDVNAVTAEGWTPLMEAVDEGHLELVELLLSKGAKINVLTDTGRTALTEAVDEGHLPIVEKLIEKGAKVSHDGKHRSALMEAVDEGHLEIVQLIVSNGADINVTNDYGTTALMEAVEEGNIHIVRYLLDNGAEVNAKTENGWTALMEASSEGIQELTQLLIDRGANVNSQANRNQTTVYGEKAIVYILKGWTSLFEAIDEEEEEIVEILLDNGANINQGIEKKINNLMEDQVIRHQSWSPLMEAVTTGNLHLVTLLVNRGADPRHSTEKGMSVLDVAKEAGHEDIIQYLKSVLK
ncbi:MAG: ankyrin repeat domain-containing protein [Bacteroidota bacterium]